MYALENQYEGYEGHNTLGEEGQKEEEEEIEKGSGVKHRMGIRRLL